MAFDKTEPRSKLIANVFVISVVTLVGLKFALDSYHVKVNEAVTAEKQLTTFEPLVKLREGEQKRLSQGTPIAAAMAELAKSGRTPTGGAADIAPQPSDDMGPMTGWSKAPKKPMAVPSGSEIQACKDAASIDARTKAAQHAVRHGGTVQLVSLRFEDGKDTLRADPETAQAVRDLAALAASCPEIALDVAVHTSKDLADDKAQKLTEQRAASLKKALVAAGVKEAALASVTGAGSSKPLVAEPDPASEAGKKLTPADLEAIRAQNRRVSVTVTKHCP